MKNLNFTITALYFVRSGWIEYDKPKHYRFAGNSNVYWLATAASNIWDKSGFGAYYFNFNASVVYTLRGPEYRHHGDPLGWLKGVTLYYCF